MDYSNYEAEDFASDELFIRWVIDNDRDATLFWEAYMLANPQAADRIELARNLLVNLQRMGQQGNTSEAVDRTWERIQLRIADRVPKRSFFALKVAASVSVITILGLAWYFSSNGSAPSPGIAETISPAEHDFVESLNTTGETITINLSDGSVVRLENNSRLRYFKDCTNSPYRSVYLTGEAFFDIAKNSQQPFLVYANEVVTKVLGTSFRVKAYQDEQSVVVSVQEGKVSVSSAKGVRKREDTIETEVNGVVLLPNQEVRYLRAEDSFNKTLVDAPQVIREEALQQDFSFRSTPVRDVFRILSEAYGVEIIFDEQGLENCYLTVPLGDEPLFEKMKIICHTIGATYELIDANIVISSGGCGRDEAR